MVLQGTLPQQALAVVAEPLAVGRRVAVFGDSTAGLDTILLEQGARSVTVFDPDADRAGAAGDHAPAGAEVLAFADEPGHGAPELRSVDVAIIADLGLFPDPAALVARARRMVGDYGVAVFAAANAEASVPGGQPQRSRAFDYYALFDLVASEFHTVTMVAQLPFYGVALMELGGQDEDPAAFGVNVDTRLADGARTPDAFVVVASQGADRALHPFSIVELPADDVLAESHTPDEDLVAELSDAKLRVSLLASQLDLLTTQLDQMRERAATAERALESLPTLEREIVDRTRRHGDLEAESARAADAFGSELARMEEGLRERAQAIRALESEVARRDRIVRDLVSALEDAPRDAAPAEPPAAQPDGLVEAHALLRTRLDALALEFARREGEAHASAWKIEELERKLAQSSSAADMPDVAEGRETPASASALDEIDALRQALVQEHQARIRAESGEELLRARAEIERQAALLNELAPGGREVSR